MGFAIFFTAVPQGLVKLHVMQRHFLLATAPGKLMAWVIKLINTVAVNMQLAHHLFKCVHAYIDAALGSITEVFGFFS